MEFFDAFLSTAPEVKEKVIEWCFYILLTLGVKHAAKSLREISTTLTQMTGEMKVVIEQLRWHEKILEEHRKRINTLEVKPKTSRKTKGK